MTFFDGQVLARNLEALAQHPGVLGVLESVEPYDGTVAARSGEPTLVLTDASGQERSLHSRYQPRAEAKKHLPDVSDPLATYLFLGAGLGYGPLELCELVGSENTLIWVEPDARLFRTAIEVLDLAAVFQHPRTRLLVGTEPRALYELLLTDSRAMLAAHMRLIPHPPSVQRAPELWERFRKSISDFVVHGSVQVRTAFLLTRRIFENKCSSLGPYLTSVGVRPLEGALEGQPLLIVCAGPSLRHNLDVVIDKAAGRVPILAVSTALRLLLSRGVVPDLTNVIDYHRISARYFESMDEQQAPPILAELGASNEALRTHPGAALFSNDRLMNFLFDGIAHDKGELPQSSSVAAGAFQVAAYLKADPVIFCGLDLSYPGGILHVPGTAIHNAVFPRTHRFHSLESWELEYYMSIRSRMYKVPSVDGGEVPTEEVLYSYLKELGAAFERYSGRVVDASEGGARLEGTEILGLEMALAKYAVEAPVDLRGLVRRAQHDVDPSTIGAEARVRVDELAVEVERLLEIYRQMVPLLDEVIERTEGGQPADRLAVELQKLGERADAQRRATVFFKSLAQSDMWALRNRDDRLLDSSEESGAGLQLQQATRDRGYLRAVLEAADTAEALLEQMKVSVSALTRATVGY